MKELKRRIQRSERIDADLAKWKAELADLTKRYDDAIEVEDFDLVDELQGAIEGVQDRLKPGFFLTPEGVKGCEHFFDMRGKGGNVKDQCSGLMAKLKGGARRTEEGVVLDGKKGSFWKKGSYVKLDPWPIGGPTSIEVYVRYANFDTNYARVFWFGQNNGHDTVSVYNDDNDWKKRIRWWVDQGSKSRYLYGESTCFNRRAWVHTVVTACGSTLCIYKNGELALTATDGWEPNTLTRDLHCIGSYKGKYQFLNGTVAFLRSWGVALKADEVQKLYASRNIRYY